MTLLFLITLVALIFIYTELKKEQRKYPYPIAFHTVDIALYKKVTANEGYAYMVCMGQKKKELGTGLWRFPGGFVDPTDKSAEAAVLRECGEEVEGIINDGQPKYITSMLTNDERYRTSRDKILTTFYKVPYITGTITPGDDLAAVQWMPIDERTLEFINPIHKELFVALINDFKTQA